MEEGLGNTPSVGVVVKEGDDDHKDKYSSHDHQKVNKSTGSDDGGDVIKIHDHDDGKEERVNVVAISDHIHDKQTSVEQKGDDENQAAVLQVKQRSKRVATLDAFRGLTIVVILIN